MKAALLDMESGIPLQANLHQDKSSAVLSKCSDPKKTVRLSNVPMPKKPTPLKQVWKEP